MTFEEILNISVKTLIFYFFLLFILKIMGKREIGKVSTFDIVVFFVISELFSLSLNDPNGSILHSIVPITIIVILQLLTAFLSLKIPAIRNVMEGELTFIIYKGKINIKEMKKQRYNIDDLMSQLRLKDIQYPSEVEFAILEDNGVLNVIKKSDCTLKDPSPLISDGVVNKSVLKRLKMSKSLLIDLLNKEGYYNISDIFLCLMRDDNSLYIILNEHL